MNKVQIIAVELPFLISFAPRQSINACALKDGKLHVYTCDGELLPGIDYFDYINTLEYAVKEKKYAWCDFKIPEGEVIYRSFDEEILIDNSKVECFTKLKSNGKGKISDTTLRLFNEFLKETNTHNPDMVEALNISLADGFFRLEVEDIVKSDTLESLSELDQQIIIRCRLEGKNYIKKYIDSMMTSTSMDKYIEINYFFRRLFNLEINNYISFQHN